MDHAPLRARADRLRRLWVDTVRGGPSLFVDGAAGRPVPDRLAQCFSRLEAALSHHVRHLDALWLPDGPAPAT